MRILIAVLVLAMALMGCCGIGGGAVTPEPLETQEPGTTAGVDASGLGAEEQGESEETPATWWQTEPVEPVEPEPEPEEDSGAVVSQNQQECATMTPDCESCIAKPGCGWCKSRNGCFVGTSSGPSYVDCLKIDWATTMEGCTAPAGGSTCGQQTNCAACMSGSGCKWCRQGSICVDIDNAADCLGGWLTEMYQCAQISAG